MLPLSHLGCFVVVVVDSAVVEEWWSVGEQLGVAHPCGK